MLEISTVSGLTLITASEGALQDRSLLAEAVNLYKARYGEHWLGYGNADLEGYFWQNTIPNTCYIQCLENPNGELLAVTQYDWRDRMMMLAGVNGRAAIALRDMALEYNPRTWCTAAVADYATPMLKTLLSAGSRLQVINSVAQVQQLFSANGDQTVVRGRLIEHPVLSKVSGQPGPFLAVTHSASVHGSEYEQFAFARPRS